MSENNSNSAVGRYRFTRAATSLSGFFSQNRSTTDALNALGRWRAAGQGRDFDIANDDDDVLIVVLRFDRMDKTAGGQLDTFCEEFGVSREFLS